jgi:predicted Zn-dependent protease
MAGLLNTLARLDEATGTRRGVPNWALTHPPAADRVAKIQSVIAATSASGETNPAALERHLDGLVYGDSREKGIVRGRDFLHPILRFAVRFPNGWDITNGAEQVLAQPAESGNIAMILQFASGTGTVQQIAVNGMTKAGWQPISGERATLNGLEAFVGTYEGVMNNTRVAVQAAHVRAGEQVYVLAGIAPSAQFNAASRVFDESIRTFRMLTREEADRIQPNRVDFYVVRQGDTWTSIAKSVGDGTIPANTLAIMNGNEPGTPPRAGDRIRVVVGG